MSSWNQHSKHGLPHPNLWPHLRYECLWDLWAGVHPVRLSSW